MGKKMAEWVKLPELPEKPRKSGKIEVRVPYYASVATVTYIKDVLEAWSEYFDGFKFACGTFRLLDKSMVKKIIGLCHDHDVYVSTGGWVERVLVDGKKAVDRYFDECKEVGFDVIEISSGFARMTLEDKVAMIKRVKEIGLTPKPEITMMYGAGAGTHIVGYKRELRPIGEFMEEAKACWDAGKSTMMLESEGLTEDLPPEQWKKDVIKKVVDHFGYEKWMFEASDPEVFKWYLKNFGPKVNLFIDHTQITEFNAWRLKLWGDPDIWKGKSVKYR